MQLGQRDKELAAIGAAIGCNCRPCIEHHIPAGRADGLSDAELADAVATARAVRDEAIELLAPRIDELLGDRTVPVEPLPGADTSRAHVLVRLGRAWAPTRTRCSTVTSPPRSSSDSASQKSRRRPGWPATSRSAPVR